MSHGQQSVKTSLGYRGFLSQMYDKLVSAFGVVFSHPRRTAWTGFCEVVLARVRDRGRGFRRGRRGFRSVGSRSRLQTDWIVRTICSTRAAWERATSAPRPWGGVRRDTRSVRHVACRIMHPIVEGDTRLVPRSKRPWRTVRSYGGRSTGVPDPPAAFVSRVGRFINSLGDSFLVSPIILSRDPR